MVVVVIVGVAVVVVVVAAGSCYCCSCSSSSRRSRGIRCISSTCSCCCIVSGSDSGTSSSSGSQPFHFRKSKKTGFISLNSVTLQPKTNHILALSKRTSPAIQEWLRKSGSRINNLYLLTRPIG